MGRDAMLVRYRVMSDTRLHFSRLYFAVVAFSILLTVALWALFPVVEALALIGWVPVAGAFVAHRLLLRERSAPLQVVSGTREIVSWALASLLQYFGQGVETAGDGSIRPP